MTFWITASAMALLVALLLGRAMLRGGKDEIEDATSFDLKVYRDQLAEVERDVARGVLPAEDAERMRTEISRRILATDSAAKGPQTTAAQGPAPAVYGLLAVLVVGGSIALYAQIGAPGYGDLALQDRIAFSEEVRRARPSQQTAEDSLPEMPSVEGVPEDFQRLMDQLRETVAARPNDLQGHILLAQNEARVGNFSAAAKAQAQVLTLKAENVAAQDMGDYAELLVLAAGGYVSPEAETALREVLARAPEDGRARYYIGLMMFQTGRPDITFRLWDGLLRRGPEEASWIAPIQEQILSVASLAGVNYDMPTIGSGGAPGPSADDLEAAAGLSADERMEMIGAMVSGLSDRLATEGGPASDWARLITSLGVLNQRDQAFAVYTNALEVFAEDDVALDAINRAGRQAGVAE